VNAATATEWLTALTAATGLFLPGAALILALDHDLNPAHTPAARSIAARARTTIVIAALITAIHIDPTTVGSR